MKEFSFADISKQNFEKMNLTSKSLFFLEHNLFFNLPETKTDFCRKYWILTIDEAIDNLYVLFSI